jgi:hypothetical protein
VSILIVLFVDEKVIIGACNIIGGVGFGYEKDTDVL